MQELRQLIEGNKAGEPRARQLVETLKGQVFARPALLVGDPPEAELQQAIELAELMVLHSLASKNLREFELSMPRLRMFYEKAKTPSPKHNMFEALYLL
jgi:hypothetical protein